MSTKEDLYIQFLLEPEFDPELKGFVSTKFGNKIVGGGAHFERKSYQMCL